MRLTKPFVFYTKVKKPVLITEEKYSLLFHGQGLQTGCLGYTAGCTGTLIY